MDNPNIHAFPQDMPSHGSEAGLTKREYFSAMAMQGLLASGASSIVDISQGAIQIADQLILELEK